MTRVREPFECAGARGFRYGDVPDAIENSLPHWIEAERVEGGVELKAGRVWRVGEHVIKLSKPHGAIDTWLRASSSVRAADMHARVLPVRTPGPALALERRIGRRLTASWLVAEFVAGEHLQRAWNDDPAARATLPSFMALMHNHGVLHGDLNPRNLIWTGKQWVLIDLEGVRRGLQVLRSRRLFEDQWARIVAAVRDEDAVQPAFVEYARVTTTSKDPGAAWQRVLRRSRVIVAGYDEKLRARARVDATRR
jgi:hypothetical protein